MMGRGGCEGTSDEQNEAYCFICLDTARNGEPLERVCKCPTTVHKKWVARMRESAFRSLALSYTRVCPFAQVHCQMATVFCW